MASNPQDDTERLKEDIAALKRDIAQLTEDLRNTAAARGHEGMDQLRAKAHETGEHARDLSADLERYVAERPLTNVLVAFGAGFLIGRLLDRR